MRLAGGGLVLAVLVARLGTGPFVDGVRAVGAAPVLVAAVVTALTTLCSAWRWRTVASALGARIGAGRAVAAVYRAQFLNVALPGGVLGDVDRAVGHGRALGRLGPALRAVVWERLLGQVVQVLVTLALVIALPSPLRPRTGVVVVTAAVAVLVCAALAVLVRRARVLVVDLQRILARRAARRTVTVASVGAVAGHLSVFVVAARAAGIDAPLRVLLPVAAIVLLASAVPLNVAGWGPREGAAAWAFAAAGLGAGTGLTVAVAYGVIAAVATVPGALVLLAGRGTPKARASAPELEEAVHG